jgi:hypothetical protein
MAGTPAETQQRRAEEAARRRRIRTSLQESFRVDDDGDDDPAERALDPQLVEAFENLSDHVITREEYAAFLTQMEKKGHKRDDVAWDFARWLAEDQQKLIQEKDAEIEELNGFVQVMDGDLADARKELEEQRNIVRAVITGSQQTSPEPTGKASSKKFPDPTVWKSGTPSEWKQWKMSLDAKLRNNADWYVNEEARKDYVMKVIADKSWEIAEPYFRDNTATVSTILKALDRRWADPLEQDTARDNYQSYLQLNKPFIEFITEFQTLARTAEISEAIQIHDLRKKVNLDLQSHAASYRPKDLEDFIDYLQHTARNLEQVKEIRQRATARRGRGGGNANGSRNQRSDPSPNQSIPPAKPQSQQRPPASAQDNSWKECLNCGKKGHLYRDCPEPNQPGRDDRVAAMRKRLEAKKAAEGNRVYELADNTETTQDDEDFSPMPENE